MKKLLLIAAFLIGICSLQAAPVNSSTAARVADNFWKSVSTSVADAVLVDDDDFNHLYIFHFNQTEGFVIVAADDRAYPILAYGTDNVAGDMGPETRFWLGQYEREIEALASGVLRNDDPVLSDYIARQWQSLLDGTYSQPKSRNMLPPMLATRWDQSPYYNYYCPTGTPAGCVATAMAQVMKYWNYPPKGTGSHSYNTSYGVLSANFDTTWYEWDIMPNSLSSSTPMEQIHAVAILCYHLGVATEMDYSTDGSGTSLVGGGYGASGRTALLYNFNYRNTLYPAYKSEHTDADWVRILKEDLDAGRPILYAGYDSYAGHAFVFDGYNSSDQFHVNWGWGGAYNGYYTMGALNPTGGGVGSNSSNTFNSSNQVLLGVEPKPLLSASPSDPAFPIAGGTRTIAVTSNNDVTSAWSASSNAAWLTISPSTGGGSGATTTVSLTATPNNTGHGRTASLTIVQDSDTVVVSVRQFACSSEDMCTLTVNSYDTRSNGWAGASLSLHSTDGILYGSTDLLDGSYAIRHFQVCPDTVLAIWHGGRSDADCSFFIENADGVVWVNHAAGTQISDGDTFVIANPCQSQGGLDPVRITISVTSNDTLRGWAEGSSDSVVFGETHTVMARATSDYRFSRWSDGSTDNPRTFTAVTNRNFIARFETLGTDTLHYDNGSYMTAVTAGDSTFWAIRFDGSTLVGHPQVTHVSFYNIRSGYFTISVYQGDYPSQANMVSTTRFYLGRQNRYRWVPQALDPVITINHAKPLWIVMGYEGDNAPATASTWSGNDNGGWVSSDGTNWNTLSDEGIYASWMLRAITTIDNNEYTISINTNNKKYGTATGGGVYRYGEIITATAIPNEGYHFVRWTDGNTQNPRQIEVRENMSIRATFAEGEAGIGDVSSDSHVTFYVEGRTLYTRGAEGGSLTIYDALGRRVYHADNHQALSVTLPSAGVYLIRVDGAQPHKVIAF